MRFILLALLLAFSISIPAFAEGELFLKKHKSGDGSTYTAKPKTYNATPKKPDEADGDYYLSKALANQYYKHCQSARHPVLTGSSLEALCACTAAKLTEQMTIDEIEALFTNTPESVDARTKMLTTIYAPCMEYPVGDLVAANCMRNDGLDRINPAKKGAICNCLGSKMGGYVGQNAPGIVTTTLRDNPQTPDPLASFFQSNNFKIISRQQLQSCLAENGVK